MTDDDGRDEVPGLPRGAPGAYLRDHPTHCPDCGAWLRDEAGRGYATRCGCGWLGDGAGETPPGADVAGLYRDEGEPVG